MRTLIASLFAVFALIAQPALADDVSTTIDNFRGRPYEWISGVISSGVIDGCRLCNQSN